MSRLGSLCAGLAVTPLLVALASCASSSVPFLPPTRPAQFSLAGVPWGVGIDSVTTLMEPRGYNLNRVDQDGDLVFDGILFQSPTRVFAFMGDEKLVKFRMIILTADEDALTVYQNVRAELIKQYGRPQETIERYEAPYRQGDGKELDAVRAGKTSIRTYWLPDGRSPTKHVSVQVTEELIVTVDFDGPVWERESLRRRQGR